MNGDKMNAQEIEEIANDCVNELLYEDDEISIDDIYDKSHDAVEDIIGDIALEIRDILEKLNIKIID